MAIKLLPVLLLAFFAFTGCSLIKSNDHSEVFSKFKKKFPQPAFQNPERTDHQM